MGEIKNAALWINLAYGLGLLSLVSTFAVLILQRRRLQQLLKAANQD